MTTATQRIVVIASLILFLLITVTVLWTGLWNWEAAFVHSVSWESLGIGKHGLIAFSKLGRGSILLPPAVLALILLTVKHRKAEALFLFLAIGGPAIFNPIMKFVLQRPRPVMPDGHVADWNYSFPSGHAMLSSAVVLTLLVLVWRLKKSSAGLCWLASIAGIGFVLALGASRLMLEMHFPSDVLGSWAFSTGWVYAMAMRFIPPESAQINRE